VALPIPVVWTDDHRLHEPGGEVYVGVRTPGAEVPERAERIRGALERAGARIVTARDQPDSSLEVVHSPELLAYLAGAWEEWTGAGLDRDPGQDRVVPYLFPTPGFAGETGQRDPAAPAARAGRFAYDTMTLIGPGTWRAARGAADVAATSAQLVVEGEGLAYACCRPPGHHVTREAFGGSCYLNNSAVAAATLREATGGPVAVIDIDAHHGNGTQSIFYRDPGVLTASVHVDPGAGWFPHHMGFAGEDGAGEGVGANRNLPLAPGTGDDRWLEAVAVATEWAAGAGARALVVALGVDAAAGDPESPLEASADGYRAAGARLGAMGVPTVVVQEGGYDLDVIGELVLAALSGLASGHGYGASG
jgi:acetoin utilization deacetylase AcuC-like enzyme